MRLRWRWLYGLPGAFLGWWFFLPADASGLDVPIGLERPSNPGAHLRGVEDYGCSFCCLQNDGCNFGCFFVVTCCLVRVEDVE